MKLQKLLQIFFEFGVEIIKEDQKLGNGLIFKEL